MRFSRAVQHIEQVAINVNSRLQHLVLVSCWMLSLGTYSSGCSLQALRASVPNLSSADLLSVALGQLSLPGAWLPLQPADCIEQKSKAVVPITLCRLIYMKWTLGGACWVYFTCLTGSLQSSLPRGALPDLVWAKMCDSRNVLAAICPGWCDLSDTSPEAKEKNSAVGKILPIQKTLAFSLGLLAINWLYKSSLTPMAKVQGSLYIAYKLVWNSCALIWSSSCW